MDEHRVTLKDQLEAFKNGTILASDGRTGSDGCWNFYDWFCKDSALEAKSRKLMRMLVRFVKAHPELDLTKHYAWFKNNCPMCGPLYDDIRITEMKDDGVNYWVIIPKSGHTGKAELYRWPEYGKPIKEGRTFTDLIK